MPSLYLFDHDNTCDLRQRRQYLRVLLVMLQSDAEHRTGIAMVLFPSSIDLHTVDLNILCLDSAKQYANLVERFQLHINVHISGIFQQIHFKYRQEMNAQESKEIDELVSYSYQSGSEE